MKIRFYALLTHLGISCMIAGAATALVFLFWYPAPLHHAVGVTEIFFLLLGVDITLGPVCTFIIFKPGKPSLKFDLTVIALCQLAALGYGMNSMFEGRPAFVVFSQDRFDITRALDIDPKSAKTAQANHNASATVSWLKPQWVGAKASSDPKRSNEILFSSLGGGADWPQLPELFIPLEQLKAQMLSMSKPLEALRELNKNNSGFEASISGLNKSVKWLPLKGRNKDMAVIIDPNTADIIKVVEAKPW